MKRLLAAAGLLVAVAGVAAMPAGTAPALAKFDVLCAGDGVQINDCDWQGGTPGPDDRDL